MITTVADYVPFLHADVAGIAASAVAVGAATVTWIRARGEAKHANRSRIEEPTREMLGYAIRGELPELEAKIEAVGDEAHAAGITLCMIIAGYIAVDVSAGWPTEADVREIARHTAATSRKYELREQDVYDYLSRGVLGFQPIQEVFPDPEQDYTLPVLITARMLVAFRLGDGHHLWGYLDTVWNAVEAAERADLSLLPALTLRSRRIMAAKEL